ncbi:MAG: dihydropteroate synthase, partial [Lachnospiraceae bacterium]|nr:dihydropteroate synthase [Lachnospiraceae bacterium]
DMGPIGQLLEPTGSLTFEEAYDIYREIVEAGKDADLIIIETMTDLYETKAAVLAAKENSNLPIFVTMTFEENGRTFTGCSVSAMCLTLCGLGVDALGVNCSLGPKDLVPIVEEISKWSDVPIIVKPNAGLPDPVTNAYNVDPEEFANSCASMLPFGAQILGGCCGTNPSYIASLRQMLYDAEIVEAVKIDANGAARRPARIRDMAICSPLKTVVVSEPRIIGERINPTGKKRFRQALKEEDMDYILGMAIQQVEAGADILDVNVGAPGIDEKAMMVKVIKALQSVVDVPLQIDSTKPEVLEAALRVYNGKPLVNSVNGEKAVMDKILPLVAKYGAAVVGLTLDENGIPKDADGRIAIAEKIVDNARALGIKKENIAIDCLVLTVSAEQKAAMETLKAVRRVREDLGLKNVLGVSNISFGLPNRSNINTTFLTMALSAGLDLPIMNPNLPQMMWTVKAFKVLAGHDKNSLGFIEYSSDHNPIDVQLTEAKKELDEARAEITAMRSGWAEVAGYAASFAGSDSISPAGSAMNVMPSVPALSIANHPAGCTCEKCRAVNKAKAEFAASRVGRTVTGGMGAAGAESMHVT